MTQTITGYSAKSIDELPELWDGFARLVRAGLGITAFGAQIMQLPPDYTTESHDEADTGQQELYVALGGTGAVVIGNEEAAALLNGYIALWHPAAVRGRSRHRESGGNSQSQPVAACSAAGHTAPHW